MKTKVIIIPGNGNTDISENWYPFVKKELESKKFEVLAQNMPDPKLARKDVWLPFIEKELKADETTIAIGHSSGAVAIMRYLESRKLLGAVLVGACHTDLGDEDEKLSGYYTTPWNWQTIKDNSQWIVQYASQDDPYIPIEESRFIHEQLSSEYHEYTDQGHFGADTNKIEFPELIQRILSKVSKES